MRHLLDPNPSCPLIIALLFILLQVSVSADVVQSNPAPQNGAAQAEDLLCWRPTLSLGDSERTAGAMWLSSKGKLVDIPVSSIRTEERKAASSALGCCAAVMEALLKKDEQRYTELCLSSADRDAAGKPQTGSSTRKPGDLYAFLMAFLAGADNSDARVVAQYRWGGLEVTEVRVRANKAFGGQEAPIPLPMQEYTPGHYRLAEEFVHDPVFQFLNSRTDANTLRKVTEEELPSFVAGFQNITISHLWGDKTGRNPVKFYFQGTKVAKDWTKVRECCGVLAEAVEKLRPELRTGTFTQNLQSWQQFLRLFSKASQSDFRKIVETSPEGLLFQLPAPCSNIVYIIKDAELFIPLYGTSLGEYQCTSLLEEGNTLVFTSFPRGDALSQFFSDQRTGQAVQAWVSGLGVKN